jgi:hypothetical protein
MTTKHTGIVQIGQREFSLYEEMPLGEHRPDFCIWRVVETRTGEETALASVNALERWFLEQSAYAAMRATHVRH